MIKTRYGIQKSRFFLQNFPAVNFCMHDFFTNSLGYKSNMNDISVFAALHWFSKKKPFSTLLNPHIKKREEKFLFQPAW